MRIPAQDNNGKWIFSVKDFSAATYDESQRAIEPTYRQFGSEHELNQYNSAFGYHWFDADSKRFFASKVYTPVYHHKTDVKRWNLFVSSERHTYTGEPRLYSVRQLQADGGIETIGEFQQYKSLAAARKAIQNYLKG